MIWTLGVALIAYLGLVIFWSLRGVPNKVYHFKRFVNLIFSMIFLIWIMELVALGTTIIPGMVSMLETRRILQTTEVGNLVISGGGLSYIILLLLLAVYGLYRFFAFQIWKYTKEEQDWSKEQTKKDWNKIKSWFKKGEN